MPKDETKKEGWGRLVYLLEQADRWFYVLIGVAFVYLARATFVHSWITFVRTAVENPIGSVMRLINEMLLILIILELLGTIITYLKVHAIRLEQFFSIGIIACIRRVLAAGSHHSFSGQMEEGAFRQYLWDIGINGGLILLLAFALFIFRRRPAQETPSHP